MKLLVLAGSILLPMESSAIGFSRSGHYYSEKDKCVFSGSPSAFELGERLAHGEPLLHELESLLYGFEFNPQEDVIEPLYLAFAFYIVAERIGDKRGVSRQNWALPYIHPDIKDRVISAVYRKYSPGYLKKCFATGQTGVSNNRNAPAETGKGLGPDSNYYLYMYQQ